ncbi:MAG: twin-arginine translocase subunit TatC [Thermoprotei archaeon]
MSRDQPEHNSILSYISELSYRLTIAIIIFGVEFLFFFFFTLRRSDLGSIVVYYPYPSFFDSISTQVFHLMVDHFVYKQFTLINIGSFDALVSTLYVAALLAGVFSVPVWAYEISAFVSPALTPHEKKLAKSLVIPATILFVAGVFFAYQVVLPVLFSVMHTLTVSLGIEPTMSVRSFITIVVAYMVALGLSFELPVFMVGLSYIGIVSYETWRSGWRWAVLGCFFIALLISPGATGGLMETVIGLTLSSLYFVGLLVVRLMVRKQEQK